MVNFLAAIPVLGGIIEKGLGVIDQFVEDKDQANKIKAQIRQQIEGQMHAENMASIQQETAWITGQLAINKQAAAHKSLFVAGARPAILWICGTALAYQYIMYPILCWAWAALVGIGHIPADLDMPPAMSLSELFPLMLGLLGIGGMRSFDKTRGTGTNSIGTGKIL